MVKHVATDIVCTTKGCLAALDRAGQPLARLDLLASQFVSAQTAVCSKDLATSGDRTLQLDTSIAFCMDLKMILQTLGRRQDLVASRPGAGELASSRDAGVSIPMTGQTLERRVDGLAIWFRAWVYTCLTRTALRFTFIRTGASKSTISPDIVITPSAVNAIVTKSHHVILLLLLGLDRAGYGHDNIRIVAGSNLVLVDLSTDPDMAVQLILVLELKTTAGYQAGVPHPLFHTLSILRVIRGRSDEAFYFCLVLLMCLRRRCRRCRGIRLRAITEWKLDRIP